jgi:ribosome-associated translation inhibitor RaiA
MKVNIKSTNLELTEAIKAYIYKKMEMAEKNMEKANREK